MVCRISMAESLFGKVVFAHPPSKIHRLCVKCAWFMTKGPRTKISLSACIVSSSAFPFHVPTVTSPSFRYDYVEVYDGKDTSTNQLGHFCGNQVRSLCNIYSGTLIYGHLTSKATSLQ